MQIWEFGSDPFFRGGENGGQGRKGDCRDPGWWPPWCWNLLGHIFFIVEKEGDGTGADQELGRGVVWNDAVLVMLF